MKRVFITGMGVISAIGNTVTENHSALKNGVCGITTTADPVAGSIHVPLAAVSLDNELLRKKLQVHDPAVTRTTLLALHAFREAVQDAGLTAEELNSDRTALIGGTTVGGMSQADELYRDVSQRYTDSPFLSSYDCSSVFMFLQESHRMEGIVDTINTACSSAANAIGYGTRLIRSGLAKRAIVGGADSLSKFTISGFKALHILSPEICRPFDRHRQGLNLGEGAAFLVLEGEEEIPTHKKVYAEVKGYFNSSDAFHPTSLSADGEGPHLAMQGALNAAGLNASEVDFINAHGTATENNDESESKAMIRVFGEPPPFISTKSNTGHTLGAAAAVEAVYSLLSLAHQEIYPSLHFSQGIPGLDLHPVTSYRRCPLRHVMSNSFGFGGNCVSLIFSKS
ncbi:beta-ketoacyl-[acyl-carrier-protein] synthase family protein [Flavitalea sp. BT771]|uniref:beta-ketoacyl-[acyl-carrier-protein] synthase family protein n=1 Tax=Flavitalea sp. BT771 TaxID=3063329 RepID=UPI0026E36BEE|nr:beta-ketoacyl-[acyl-carrier-protein] synthase family protein [Flavitalea sp. BT771]MDO6429982.1 beta-ketoacyl-[acyl-carrier-protein] synthase family protein [Flavitalea sp. BT771]MDV6217890.1 beta-ketoacyl-[acyl-carrier-protein] synthase family protein [Flavitalea sp. BT771]